MKSLRTQLLWSHLVLVGLMVVLMVGATSSFFHLGRSIDRILRDNYQSVMAAQTMKEALERMDSAATFALAGEQDKARRQYPGNRAIFETALSNERNNITEAGEQPVADEITRQFGAYRYDIEPLIFGTGFTSRQQRGLYFGRLEPSFAGLKARVQQVLDLNQAAMRRRDAEAKAEAQRATGFGLAMTLGALLLAVAFARRAINNALTPLLALSQGAEEIGAGHLNRRIELNRADEIGTLASAFNDMAAKLRQARQIEQHRLHRAEKMSDAALEALYDPVLVTDATGTVVHLNHAAEKLFGPDAQATGRPVAQVTGEEHIVRAIEGAVRRSQISADEGERALAPLQVEGRQRIYRLRATPMRDEETETTLGAALVLQDITELDELSRLKTEFISVASHELRTPVTSLMLSAQLLDEGAAGALTETQREVVTAQREDLARLDQLMRDLLDITRLEAGTAPPHFEMVPASELVAQGQQAVAREAESKAVHLEITAPSDLPSVRADRAQVGRVLVNLLNNAIRHTPARGRVQLQAQPTGDGVSFCVRDTGEGIPPDYLGHIFSRFVQVPGATRGGAGLGLSIAQQIVKAHGGEIKVHSEVGRGSNFEFELKGANGGGQPEIAAARHTAASVADEED